MSTLTKIFVCLFKEEGLLSSSFSSLSLCVLDSFPHLRAEEAKKRPEERGVEATSI